MIKRRERGSGRERARQDPTGGAGRGARIRSPRRGRAPRALPARRRRRRRRPLRPPAPPPLPLAPGRPPLARTPAAAAAAEMLLELHGGSRALLLAFFSSEIKAEEHLKVERSPFW